MLTYLVFFDGSLRVDLPVLPRTGEIIYWNEGGNITKHVVTAVEWDLSPRGSDRTDSVSVRLERIEDDAEDDAGAEA